MAPIPHGQIKIITQSDHKDTKDNSKILKLSMEEIQVSH
jgi:hypothetical protein